MKNLSQTNSILMIALVLTFILPDVKAEDSTLRNESPHFIEDGWDVRLGAGIGYDSSKFYRGIDSGARLDFQLDINYSNGNFFFSTTEEEFLLIGYSLVREKDWIIDVVIGPKFHADFSMRQFDGQLAHLDKRDQDLHLGPRFSWYGEDNRVSVSLTRDVISTHDGFIASADYQQEWQIKNWLLTGQASISLFSEEITNHIVGVSAAEATVHFPQYDANGGQSIGLALTAEYPMNENWIFETKAEVTKFSSEFNDSPVIEDNTLTVITSGFKYQF